jgi:hypothetical protein
LRLLRSRYGQNLPIHRLLYQTNTGSDRENVQSVFVWRCLQPFGTVQLGFQRGPLRLGSQTDESAVFVKATAVF